MSPWIKSNAPGPSLQRPVSNQRDLANNVYTHVVPPANEKPIAGGQVRAVVPFGSVNSRNDLSSRQRPATSQEQGNPGYAHVHIRVHVLDGARHRCQLAVHDRLRAVDLALRDDPVRLKVRNLEPRAAAVAVLSLVPARRVLKLAQLAVPRLARAFAVCAKPSNHVSIALDTDGCSAYVFGLVSPTLAVG